MTTRPPGLPASLLGTHQRGDTRSPPWARGLAILVEPISCQSELTNLQREYEEVRGGDGVRGEVGGERWQSDLVVGLDPAGHQVCPLGYRQWHKTGTSYVLVTLHPNTTTTNHLDTRYLRYPRFLSLTLCTLTDCQSSPAHVLPQSVWRVSRKFPDSWQYRPGRNHGRSSSIITLEISVKIFQSGGEEQHQLCVVAGQTNQYLLTNISFILVPVLPPSHVPVSPLSPDLQPVPPAHFTPHIPGSTYSAIQRLENFLLLVSCKEFGKGDA